jgi:hypothetical protein
MHRELPGPKVKGKFSSHARAWCKTLRQPVNSDFSVERVVEAGFVVLGGSFSLSRWSERCIEEGCSLK